MCLILSVCFVLSDTRFIHRSLVNAPIISSCQWFGPKLSPLELIALCQPAVQSTCHCLTPNYPWNPHISLTSPQGCPPRWHPLSSRQRAGRTTLAARSCQPARCWGGSTPAARCPGDCREERTSSTCQPSAGRPSVAWPQGSQSTTGARSTSTKKTKTLQCFLLLWSSLLWMLDI